jgi:hypothetical protein
VAELILGPVLRYVRETEATVWVETDSSCEVDVLGHRERTFCVEGHHYAIVAVAGLEPGGTYEYEVLAASGLRLSVLPAQLHPHDRSGPAAEDRVRLLPGGSAARATLDPHTRSGA